MPQIGNKCPGLDERHEFKNGHCLSGCKAQCMPASVLVHIENKHVTDKHVGEYISVTALLGCLRKTFGERTIPYFVEPPRSWYSLRGTIIHNILQNPDFASQVGDMKAFVYRLFKQGVLSKDQLEQEWCDLEARLMDFALKLPKPKLQDWETEVEYEYPLGIINGRYRYVRGTIDVLRRMLGVIVDYKTMGDRGISVIKDGPKHDNVWQFNMYRLLVERGYPVGESYRTYKPITIKEIRAYYMTMMQVVGTGTNMEVLTGYQVKEPDNHRNLVLKECIDTREDLVTKRGRRKNSDNPDDFELSVKNKWKMLYKVPDVPLLDLDVVETFVNDTARKLVEAFDTNTLPEMAKPETRQWLCDFCPAEVQQACDAKNDIDGVMRIVDPSDAIPVEA